MTSLKVTVIGGPTALIEIGGLRLLTDPTFDAPGEYPIGERALVKTRGPALAAGQVGPLDAVLLSHDQHPDNLDASGRELLPSVPLVLTTVSGASRLDATALAPWRAVTIPRPDGRTLRVTGVPALHGPAGTEDVTGEVTGFVLSGEGVPTVYVSGDNASLDVVRDVAAHCPPIDVALLFAGAARTPLLDAYLTLGSDQAAEAAAILGAPAVVPLHVEGWQHFTEGPDSMRAAFARHDQEKRLVLLAPGESATLP